jgi:hypothetical protein
MPEIPVRGGSNMDQLVENGNIGLAWIVLLVAALMVLVIRRIIKVRKIVADALAEGIKKSKEPEKSAGEQPGGTPKP